jgi:AcrR family transcriptional regulator
VTKAALYYHFKDKEELFLAILKLYLDEMELALQQITDEPTTASEQIRLFVEYVLKQPTEQRAIIRLASQEMGHMSEAARKTFDLIYHQKFIDKVQSILVGGMQNGEFHFLNPEVATWALLGIMFPYFYPNHTGNLPLPDETIQEIVILFIHGIARNRAE